MHPPQSHRVPDSRDLNSRAPDSRDLAGIDVVAAVSAQTWDAIRTALTRVLGEADDTYLVEDEVVAE